MHVIFITNNSQATSVLHIEVHIKWLVYQWILLLYLYVL